MTNEYEFVMVGSQSMRGPVPHPEAVFTVSMEADIYPPQAPELADQIDGDIGEGSQFHQTFWVLRTRCRAGNRLSAQ